MRSPSLPEGVAFALAAGLGSSVLFTAFGAVLSGATLLRLLVAGLGFAYVLYLLGRSQERVGRVVTAALWSAIAALAWWLPLPLPLYLLVHLGFVWMVRSLYHHESVMPAMADLGLVGLGLAAALWAVDHTESVFLSVWCFFLVQSIFVLIPPRFGLGIGPVSTLGDEEERFERAHRNAESALRSMQSTP